MDSVYKTFKVQLSLTNSLMRTKLQRIISSRFVLLLVMLTSLTFSAYAQPTSAVTPSSVNVCAGATVNLTNTAAGADAWEWQENNITVFSGSPSYSFTALIGMNGNTYRSRASSDGGLTWGAYSNVVPLTVTAIPATPSGFSGSTTPCQGSTVTYSVTNDPTASSYSWNYTGSGATFAGSGNTINVTFSNTATSGNLTVSATNSCGTSTQLSTAIAIQNLPATPGGFTVATTPVCQGQAGVTYTVPAVAGATSYTWSYSGAGATYSASTAGPTNSLTFSNSATSGTLSVMAVNSCGTSGAQTYAITVNPLAPIAFSITGTATVCAGQTGVSYSVPFNAGVTSYAWTYTGSGATIVNNNTNSITINFSNNATNGSVQLIETNSCGTNNASYAVAVDPLPTLTGPISGATPVCQSTGPTNYTVAGGSNITTYNWNYTGSGVTYSNTTGGATNALTFGATATSGTLSVYGTNACGTTSTVNYAITVDPIPATPASFSQSTATVCQGQTGVVYTVPNDPTVTTYNWTYTGANTTINGSGNSVTLDFGAAASSGTLSVTATNSCGTSSARTMAITVNSTPATPSAISGNATPCQGQTVTYSVTNVVGVTYAWTYSGSGATITNLGGGQASITYSNTATSGTLSVTASNSCGTSTASTQAITMSLLPATPGGFTVSTSPVCQGTGPFTYTVPAVAGATSYNWTYSGAGATFSATTATPTNSVSFGASATSGTLSVTATNSCGTSGASNFNITVNPTAPAPGAITGNAAVCQGQNGISYSVPLNANITTYTWTYSGSGATINNNGSNAITINFSNTATGGTLSISASNACGTNATPSTLVITVNTLPTLAGPVSGTTPACQGTTQNYTVAGGAGITTYNWSYTGTGATFSATTASNTNAFTFSNSATSGTLIVSGTNSCGTTSTINYPITINPIANTPASFSASSATVCQGQTGVVYTVPFDPTVTTYNWTYTGANTTINGTGNSVTLDFGAAATSGTLSVTATNSCGTSAARSMGITVNAIPATPSLITGTTAVCQSQTFSYSVTNVVGVTYNWSYSGAGATITNLGGGQASVTYSATATSGTLSVTATNSCGTSSPSNLVITVTPTPATPGGFTVSTSPVCQGTGPFTYTVPAVTGATSYNWSYTGTGATFSATTATPTNNLTFSASATSGILSVTATNTCGTSGASTVSITVTPTAPAPGPISGTIAVCQGQNNVTYSVPSNPNITAYTWSYTGGGATINNNGSATVNINYSASATSGTLSIVTSNSCGANATPSTLVITVSPAPVLAGPMTGPAAVCQGAVGQTYTVSGAANITTYNWSYSGTGATFAATTGTNSNSLTFSNTATSGTLSVTGTNTCGTTTAVNYVITVNALPATPSGFTTASPSVCQGQTGVIYTVPNDPNVTTYNWAYSGTGASFAGTGNTITVNFSASATSGNLTVSATNACGTSTDLTLPIVVTPSPLQPSAITGTTTPCQGQNGVIYSVTNDPSVTYVWSYSGTGATITNLGSGVASIDFSNTATGGTLSVYATNACGNSITRTLVLTPTVFPAQPGGFTISSPNVCQGQTGVTYSVPAVPGATSYLWTYSGTGATINGTTNTVTIDYSATATSGILSVSAVNTCGTSAARTMNVTVTPAPAQPGAFTQSNPTPCQGQNGVVYTVPNDPNIVSYTWTYSGSGATFVGNVNGNSVTIDWSNTATNGTLSVTGTNSCGTSAARTLAIALSQAPLLTSGISATFNPVCQSTSSTFTVTGTNVTTYNWTYSGTGATFPATTATGSNTFAFSNTATSGTVSVTGTNTCGTSAAQTLAVTVTPLPGTPGLFTSGPNVVCQGNVNITYTTGTATDATSYNWTYSGTGVVINTTGNNTANLDFTNTATSGTLSVFGVNSCGQSVVARTMAITVNSLPNQPSPFTTSSAVVCQGQLGVIYTVPNDPTVTYTWTYTVGTGATINGVGNSVSVDFSNTATSGTLNVFANNACGTSTPRSISIIVNPLPATPAAITGDITICQGETGVPYSIPAVVGATSYTWSYSGTGVTINNNGNTNITIDYSATATSGTLSVVAVNACGNSPTPSTVNIDVDAPPAVPGPISGATTVCVGQTGVIYSVTNDPNVTYTWSYAGTGATINGTGNSVSIDFSATATTGVLSVTATSLNGCATSGPSSLSITVTPIPLQPGAITGSITPCQGVTEAYSIAAVANATTYTWSYSGTGATINNNGNTNITIDFANNATSGTLSVTAANTCGTSPAQTVALTVQPGAFQPGNFTTASTTVCAGGTANYVVPNVVGSTYNWSYSGTGATISGAPNSAVTVTFANNATSGVLSVTATNVCGTSPARSIGITVNPLPTTPASFLVSSSPVCQGQTNVTYAVVPDPAATSYSWSYSGTGATINGTGSSVTIDFANNATAGTLSVSSVNSCGTSAPLTMAITVDPLPLQPGVITGNAIPCQGATGVAYSVVNDPNITTYNWSYSGNGATINGGGNAITIDFSNTATSGTLSVTGTNSCGTSIARTYNITVSPLPTTPGNFTNSTAVVCQGQTGVLYTVPNVVGNTYTWTYSGSGVTGFNTTNSVTLDFSATASSGTLSVTTTNACGTSSARTMAITVNAVPATPGAITGTTPVCAGANGVNYSVTNDPLATSYTWTYSGNGATINGTGSNVTIDFAANATSGLLSVTANNACGSSTASTLAITVTPIPGQPSAITGASPVCANTLANAYSVTNDPNATSYTWTYSGNGATINGNTSNITIDFSNTATSGTLTVVAVNACGTSVARTRNITITPLPSQPGAFTQGTPTVCQGQNGVVYTVTNDPTVTYTWTYTVGTGATINGTGNTVSVDFSNTATSGVLNVTATNACGTSIARSMNITVNPLPTAPGPITGTTPVCQGQNGVPYSVVNDPTVTYTWSYTGTGGTITGNGNSILISFSNTATSGDVSVTATNSCGTSTATTFAVTVTPLPNQPSVITGAASACAGSNANPYSVTLDPTITTYNWSYSGLGSTINGVGNAITVDFANNATSGTLTVTGTNACGTSIARTKSITINPLPNTPGAITGPTSVCQGSNGNVYSVTNDPSVTYTWTYTVGTGATINGAGSTVTIDFSATATSGTLNVTATNACGTSTASTLAITVNPMPAAPGAITGNAAACAGTLANAYSVPAVAGTTYTWTYSGGGATITGAPSNAVTIDFANNATSGTLSVTATTACGTSAPTTLAITINPLPVMPGVISGPTPVCANTLGNAYSVTNDPAVTYNWTYSGAGATINGSGNAITVDFSNVATSGTLSVTATAINGCGTTAPRTKSITINPLPAVPATPVGLTPVCQGQNGVIYTVLNDPTVTTYTWSYSGTGASITSFGNNASVNFSNTATSGNITVTATNACGTSAPSNPFAVTVNTLPVTPGAITGTSPVCQGQNGVAYSVTNDPTVSYIWSYSGTGGTIVGGGNAITMDFSNTATSGNLTVIATNGCGTSSPSAFTILVNPLPLQPAPFSVFSNQVCAGQTGVVYTIPNDPSVTYTWAYSGGGTTINGTGNSVTLDFSLAASSGTLSVTATNACGTSIARTVAITVNPLPVQPGAITGTSPVCQGQSGVAYSVTNDPTVTYTWTYSGTGATIVGTTNAITMNFGATATGGTLSVTATNGCGTSTASTFAIVVNPLPNPPSNITGTSPVCQGDVGVAYSVTNDPTVTYTWTYSGTGATITGAPSNAITIAFSNTATSGTLSVTATNPCGTSLASTFPITVNPLPAQPAAFTVSSAVVCQGQNGVIYTVPNDPTVFYVWTYSGAGATIAGSGNSVALTFSNTATSGTLSVTANNACGTSVARTIAITVNPLPTTPGAITGTTPVCQGDVGVAYSVTNDPTVTYNWSYSGLNTSIVGSGNAITLSFGTTATSGTLSVTATNSCGTSAASTFAITVNPLPLQPSLITGPTTVCQGQNNVPYSVLNDPTITNYTWTYSGTGATITGTTNAVTISFSATATSGNLTVIANNSCGASLARVMAITVNPLPNQPAAFITSSTPVCQGQNSVIYEVPNDPTVTYTWTYSGTGATITGTGHLVSIDFSNTATSGNLDVTATNACGTSIPRTLAIVVNPLPGNPAAFTTSSPSVCQGQNGVVYTVPAVAGATSYSWTYTGTGATFAATTVAPTVSINFNTVATSGTLSVRANNACGTSLVPRTIAITVNPLPLQPADFTASNDTVCQGQAGVVYTVPNVAGTTYTWTYSGAGATIVGAPANSVTISFSAVATSGTLSVTATNACGTSSARTLTITVNPLPAQPSVITGTTPVCQGANNVLYSVTNVPSVTSYTWTYSGTGATITGTGSTVSVNFSATATSGNMQVIANNACGASAPRTLAIVVNPIPAQPSVIAGLTTVCQGTNQVYSVTNVPGTTYSWNYSGTGVTIAGAPANTVTLTYSAIATSGTLSVTATTACGTSIARTINITVNPLPQVPGNFTQMSNVVCQGQNNVVYQVPLDISVTAYNWTYTGLGATITVFGGNTANVNFSNVATSGNIQVTATNACGTSAPRVVAVTVNPLPLQPAAFTTSTAVVCQGAQNVVYTVPNDPTVTYTWSYSGTGVTVNNTNTNTATLNFDINATSGTLSVIAHNNCGASIARTIAITVNPLPNEPGAFTNGSPDVCQGQNNVIYTVPLDPTVTYNWSYSGTGATITGATNSVSISFSNTATSGLLTVTATNGCGTSTPQAMFITVHPLPTQPGPITGVTPVCQGDQYVTYSVPYDSSVTYTWTYSGTGATILGTGNLVVIDFSTLATSGVLSVTATNSCGTSAASTFAITVNQLPRVTSSPVNATLCAGGDTSFTITATGTALVYHWQVNTGTGFTDLVDNATYSGSATATLHLTAVDSAMNGYTYRAYVTGTCYPGDTSGIALLTVNTPPALANSLSNSIICEGNNTSFTVNAVGTALTYQWEVNDGTGWVNVPAAAPYSGSTSATLTITAATASMNGYQYRVTVTGTCAPPQTTNAVTLSVNFPPTITTQPAASVVTCTNASADITVAAVGAGMTYQWQVNDGTGFVNITNTTLYSGINSPNLHINAVSPTMVGFEYRVVITGACPPPVTSNIAVLSINTQVQWTGLTNTLWSEPGNWACGVLPTATTVVTITASVPNFPEVDIPTAICDSLIIDPGAKVSFIGTGNVLEIKGSIVNNGTFDASLGEVYETGTGTQSIPGGPYAIIRLNGNGDKMINANTTVTNSLVLSNGYMTLGNSDLTIASTASITGGSTVSYVVTNGLGRLINTNIGLGGRTGSILFPVGSDNTSYTPLTMRNIGVADDFMVNVLDGIYTAYDANDIPSGPAITDNSVGKTWVLNEAVSGGSDVALTLEWNASDELVGFNRNECFLSHYIDPFWNPGATGPAFGSNPYNVSRTGINTFSPFGVGSSGSPLVVANTHGNEGNVITLYPNPVSGSEIYVKFENAPKGDVTIQILDMVGKVIVENKVNTNQFAGGVIPVKIADLASGAYMLQMTDKNNKPIQAIKFNKQ